MLQSIVGFINRVVSQAARNKGKGKSKSMEKRTRKPRLHSSHSSFSTQGTPLSKQTLVSAEKVLGEAFQSQVLSRIGVVLEVMRLQQFELNPMHAPSGNTTPSLDQSGMGATIPFEESREGYVCPKKVLPPNASPPLVAKGKRGGNTLSEGMET